MESETMRLVAKSLKKKVNSVCCRWLRRYFLVPAHTECFKLHVCDCIMNYGLKLLAADGSVIGCSKPNSVLCRPSRRKWMLSLILHGTVALVRNVFFLPCPFSVLSPCHCSLSPVAGEAFGFELHAPRWAAS